MTPVLVCGFCGKTFHSICHNCEIVAMYGVASALRIRYNTEYRTAKMGYKGEHLHGEQEKNVVYF